MERQRPTRFQNKATVLRKAAAQTHAFPGSLDAILKTLPRRPVNNLISLPRKVEVEHRLWNVGAAGALYHECESLCSMMLAIAGIGIVLYSASMLNRTGERKLGPALRPCKRGHGANTRCGCNAARHGQVLAIGLHDPTLVTGNASEHPLAQIRQTLQVR